MSVVLVVKLTNEVVVSLLSFWWVYGERLS